MRAAALVVAVPLMIFDGVHVALVILLVTNLSIVVVFLIPNLLLATGVEMLTTFRVVVMGLTV